MDQEITSVVGSFGENEQSEGVGLESPEGLENGAVEGQDGRWQV